MSTYCPEQRPYSDYSHPAIGKPSVLVLFLRWLLSLFEHHEPVAIVRRDPFRYSNLPYSLGPYRSVQKIARDDAARLQKILELNLSSKAYAISQQQQNVGSYSNYLGSHVLGMPGGGATTFTYMPRYSTCTPWQVPYRGESQ